MNLLEILKEYVPNPVARGIVVAFVLSMIILIGWNIGRMIGGK